MNWWGQTHEWEFPMIRLEVAQSGLRSLAPHNAFLSAVVQSTVYLDCLECELV
jgi:hypothetical protein